MLAELEKKQQELKDKAQKITDTQQQVEDKTKQANLESYYKLGALGLAVVSGLINILQGAGIIGSSTSC